MLGTARIYVTAGVAERIFLTAKGTAVIAAKVLVAAPRVLVVTYIILVTAKGAKGVPKGVLATAKEVLVSPKRAMVSPKMVLGVTKRALGGAEIDGSGSYYGDYGSKTVFSGFLLNPVRFKNVNAAYCG